MRLKLTKGLLKLAYRFVDVEASAGMAPPDERVLEYAFVISRLAQDSPGRLLDVGCVARMNVVPVTLASLGWEVYGLDSRDWIPTLKACGGVNFNFVQGDIRHTGFPDGFFDAVCAVSTLEHIGVNGRYGITECDSRGDLGAVREIHRILHKGGLFLATVPYGKEYSESVLNRVYDEARLGELCVGWRVEEKIIDEQHSLAMLALWKGGNDQDTVRTSRADTSFAVGTNQQSSERL